MKIIMRFTLISIVFGCGICFSQGDSVVGSFEPQHLFSLSSGISIHSVRDDIMSPLLYRGSQIPLVFTFRFHGLENRHTALVYYDNVELISSITEFSNGTAVSHYINNLHLNFEYSFATTVTTLEGLKTACFLGARLSSILNLRTHYFLQGQNHISTEQMTGLGVYLLTETTFRDESNNYLKIEINIPCISYVVLPYRYNAYVSNTFDNLDFEKNLLWQLSQKGGIVSFKRLIEMQADVSYIFFVSTYVGFDLHYRLLYYSFAQYRDLFHSRVLNNQFLIGFMVTL